MAKNLNGRLITKSTIFNGGGNGVTDDTKKFFKAVHKYFFEDGYEVKSFTDYSSNISVEVICDRFGEKALTVTTYSKRKHKMLCREYVTIMDLMHTHSNCTYMKVKTEAGNSKYSVFKDLAINHKGTALWHEYDGEKVWGFMSVIDGYYFWPFTRKTKEVKLFNRCGELCGFQHRKGRKQYIFHLAAEAKSVR